MLKNFLKIAVRNLLKNKTYVAINIVGLGLALACCIVAYFNSKFNWDFDKNHLRIDNIYKLNFIGENQGDFSEFGRVPMPLAEAVKQDFSNVKEVFRFEAHTFTARDVSLDKVFNTSVCYADKGFLESFTFDLISGDPTSYQSLDKAIVTQEYAKKFYGEEDPIGKVLTVFDDTGMSFNFVIAGVVAEPQQNSSIHFELLVNFENRFRMYDDNVKNNWGSFAQNTFVYIESPSQAKSFEAQLGKYLSVQHAARPDFKISRFVVRPMNTHAHESSYINWTGLRNAMDVAAVLTPQIMAILILLVACFNFTNTAIANANGRLKEIGIRKVLGGTRRQLINQFMTENLTICFLALLLSIMIATYLVPAYSSMWQGMNLELNFANDYKLYVFLLLLLLLTTVLAGFYPSLYISKYRPVSILRGGLSIGGAGKLTKVLLGAQYTFAVIAIFASVAFIQNASYQNTLDMGYNREQVIGINLLNETQFQKIKASMLSNPAIEAVASAKNHIGQGNYSLSIKNSDQETMVSLLDVGIGYPELMGIQIVKGRSFSTELEASDSQNSILVNEKMVERFDWLEPIGQRLVVNDTTTLTVVGVVKNFYINGFWSPLEPVGIRLSSLKFQDDGTYSYIVAKANINEVKNVFEYLENEWNSKIPNKTFSGFYQDDLMRQAKEINTNILIIFTFLGSVAFILSCLGLFTLVSINLIRKKKQIGVRKVLGGGVGHIVFLISKGYLPLLLIASIIGVTAGYYLIDALIASIFNNYKEMDILTFLIPSLTIIIVSLSIAGLSTLKSALANPVKSLRYE